MILIPYDKFTVESKLSLALIKDRAINYIGVDNSIFSFSGKLKYKCNFSNNRFTIMRIVQGRNSFIPVIT